MTMPVRASDARPALTHGLGRVLVFAGVILGAWVLHRFDPAAPGSPFPPCLFLVLTGWYCPGCGITRALHALLHFDFARAIAMNPMVVASLPLLVILGAHRALPRRVPPPAWSRVLSDGRYWIAALLLFGIARNLPWWPFNALAPGG